MKTAVEISMYPLQEADYKMAIKWFIERLAQYPDIERRTNAMATQIQGEHSQVMAVLETELAATYAKFGRGVFVCKVIPGGLELDYHG